MHILIRHSFTGATKPTFVAKSLHEPLLLSFSCATSHIANLVRSSVGSMYYISIYIYVSL